MNVHPPSIPALAAAGFSFVRAGATSVWRGVNRMIAALALGVALAGCTQVPAHHPPRLPGEDAPMQKAMRRNDEIIFLSSSALDGQKPFLLLLHGATDAPTEMTGIVLECREKYNVLLYAYNYHQPIKRVAADLLGQLKVLRAEMKKLAVEDLTVVTYSYSASVIRQAVLKTEDRALFSGVSLVQLVPTAGGSYLARGLKNPVAAWFTGLASKPSAVENPYGRIARELWGKAGHQKFYEAIPPDQVQSILIEDDLHSVARIQNEEIQWRYRNGIGQNVVVIPKSTGVTHEYFPSDPIALGYLRRVLEAFTAADVPLRVRVAARGHASVAGPAAGLKSP